MELTHFSIMHLNNKKKRVMATILLAEICCCNSRYQFMQFPFLEFCSRLYTSGSFKLRVSKQGDAQA